MFSSVLISNRGEIACRIMRTAKRLGMHTIAVYSEADAEALHVRMADEAHLIGPADAAQSYLDAEKILAVAKETGAECIHPGYGFLSENAEFAESCAKAGIVFVGPPADAIRAMGLKDAAKARMEEASVPVVPGYLGADQTEKALAAEAKKIGYPVLIKAVAGGGGKGMRQVDNPKDFSAALQSCKREAQGSFGNDKVLIEKFVTTPRHIEVQVFADGHGNAIHLFERDCSLQRRHQKVIEEAPAPGMSDEIRAAMGAAGVKAALAVGYEGAGTVEFIADAQGGLKEDGFHFMEMNTRLQVEHPVTELITGLDLVELQFKVAAGGELGIAQDDLTINGHAIEARLYAEDPANDFLPQAGVLQEVEWPQNEGLRIDTGVEQESRITPFYGPMIAKLITHGSDRLEAISRLELALKNMSVFGLRTNQAFLIGLLTHPDFHEGKVETGFIARNMGEVLPAADREMAHVFAGLAALDWLAGKSRGNEAGPWTAARGWAMAGLPRKDRLLIELDGAPFLAVIEWKGGDIAMSLTRDGQTTGYDLHAVHFGEDSVSATIDGAHVFAAFREASDGAKLYVVTDKRIGIEVTLQDLLSREEAGGSGASIIRAPMSGRVIKVNVATGDSADQGDTVLILEAMKMEHALTAGVSAPVDQVNVKEGDQVEEGQVLVTFSVEE
ncbi:MAG: acetyl-CoA carboxylase biotin carboxylase subunit [Hyphomicrobiales bacterium]